MRKSFELSRFKKWEDAYLDNPDMPFLTTSAILELSELEAFVQQIKEMKADSVRICFLRFEIDKDEPQENKNWQGKKIPAGCQWVESGKGLSQAAVALIPAHQFRLDPELVFESEDIINNENKTVLLLMPGGAAAGPTGHKPPQGGKSASPVTG